MSGSCQYGVIFQFETVTTILEKKTIHFYHAIFVDLITYT